jgi:hypothetical protein
MLGSSPIEPQNEPAFMRSPVQDRVRAHQRRSLAGSPDGVTLRTSVAACLPCARAESSTIDAPAVRPRLLSMHIPVVGNTVSAFMAPPDTDTVALRAADSLAYLAA